jgi:hypothetical protein
MNAIATRVSCVLALALLSGMFSTMRAQPQTTYNIVLSHAEESVDASGQSVLTMMARGDLQGAFTVKLDRAADGTITGGEWALTVSFTEILASPTGGGGGTEEDAGEILVQKGVLKGAVTGGLASQNAAGKLDALSGVQLLLTGGTLAYDTVATGSGSIDSSSVSDRDASSGSITLIF